LRQREEDLREDIGNSTSFVVSPELQSASSVLSFVAPTLC
jgi:hypothetical protein